MFICPTCGIDLNRIKSSQGIFWICRSCNGRTASVSLLRKSVPKNVIVDLWKQAKSDKYPKKRRCPSCSKLMAEVSSQTTTGYQNIDVCTTCHFVWFDPGEHDALPRIQEKLGLYERLPIEAREKVAELEIEAIRKRAEAEELGGNEPEDWWHWIPGVLGLPVEDEIEPIKHIPWVTWGLALIICIVSIASFDNLNRIIHDFGLIPANFGRYGGFTLITSFFLHGGWVHLISNIYFLIIFGDNVEDRLGTIKFLLLIVCASFVGDLFHILSDLYSSAPCIGASGGISGIVAYYALRFPHARLNTMLRIHYFIRWVRAPAYMLFLFWIVTQLYGIYAQLAGFSNVSATAHLGGAVVGFVFWLLFRKP
ncbi:hypothetical protein BVX97_02405 [bacterium E08(2017)]|nr:hypothetical protein BVX97_02405 [bacterium E08(2017)]